MAGMPLQGSQVRMARAALRWSVRELAARAGVSPTTVAAVEADKEARSATLAVIARALTDAGVEFSDGEAPGVRLHPKAKAKRGKT